MPTVPFWLSVAVAVAAIWGGDYIPAIFDLPFRLSILSYTQISTYCYDDIKTLSKTTPKARCIAVSPAGLIVDVFTHIEDAPVNHIKSTGSVIPGLWDGHGHILQLGEFLQSINLFKASSMKQSLGLVKAYVEQHPGIGTRSNWIRGIGWDQAVFGRMPIADDFDVLDELKEKFIMLDRVDVHCIWVSNAVLSLLPQDVPAIPGGEIITDPGRGVFCDTAMDMVLTYWPKPNDKQLTTSLHMAMEHLNSVGIIGVHDAGVVPANIRLMGRQASSRDWTVRIYAMMECSKRNTFCSSDARRLKGTRSDGRLSVQSVKLFGDGALGSWGSAMLAPYSDHPGSMGSLLINGSELTDVTRQWAAIGYQVNIHAIGDLSNRLAINAFESALTTLCPGKSAKECQSNYRFRIEHAQIIHPDDQDRMLKLGIIPSIQPTHATSDMAYAELRLGEERTRTEAYRLRSMLNLTPVLGSDFPVEPPNPFHGMYTAVTRRNPKTGKGKAGADIGWYMEETLSMEEALSGFTINAARGAFLEGRAGVLEKGAFADWLVLDAPWDDIVPEDLLNLTVKETWFEGRLVYHRN